LLLFLEGRLWCEWVSLFTFLFQHLYVIQRIQDPLLHVRMIKMLFTALKLNRWIMLQPSNV